MSLDIYCPACIYLSIIVPPILYIDKTDATQSCIGNHYGFEVLYLHLALAHWCHFDGPTCALGRTADVVCTCVCVCNIVLVLKKIEWVS